VSHPDRSILVPFLHLSMVFRLGIKEGYTVDFEAGIVDFSWETCKVRAEMVSWSPLVNIH